MENIKLLVKQIILNVKFIFGSKSQILLLLMIPILIAFIIPTIFFRIDEVYGFITALTLTICLFSVYSAMVGQYKKSTLYVNNSTTKSNKWIFNLASALTLMLIGYSIYIFQTLILLVLGEFSLLTTNSIGHSKEFTINVLQMKFIWNFYWVGMIILITFSISFAMYEFISNSKTFFIVVTTLLLLMLIFGAIFNDYFKSFALADGSENWGQEVFLVFYKENNGSTFPVHLYGASLLYPYYATNQMLNISSRYMIWDNSLNDLGWTALNTYHIWNWQTAADYSWNGMINQSWRFNILYFIPYIQSAAWISIGVLVSKLTKR